MAHELYLNDPQMQTVDETLMASAGRPLTGMDCYGVGSASDVGDDFSRTGFKPQNDQKLPNIINVKTWRP